MKYRLLSHYIENSTTLVNECLVQVYLYLLLGLTDFNSSSKEMIGWTLLTTVLASFTINILKTVILVAISCRLKWLRRRASSWYQSPVQKYTEKTPFEISSKGDTRGFMLEEQV
jgi:hypothetical protein